MTPNHYEFPPLSLATVQAHAAHHLRTGGATPYLLCDLNIVTSKVDRLRAALPGVTPYYAMKANPDPRILAHLHTLGVPFEVASVYELETLLSLGVDASSIIFSNPVKPREAVEAAYKYSVTTMVVDHLDEVQKIASVSREIQLCLRLETSNTGSDWPLTGKFGASTSEALAIIDYCGKHGLPLMGLTFHVGSQCRNLDNWHTGISGARLLLSHMETAGLTPTLLNLGGGFPVQHTRPMPSIEAIGATITDALTGLPETVSVMAEPGRYLVGDSAWMVTRVVGTATRKGHRWLYLDVGAFTGLGETLEQFDYELLCDRDGPLVAMTVAGPTCDTADLLFHDKLLPGDLQEGDLIYLPNAGAYTTAYASTFNGFPLPEMVLKTC